MQFQSINEAITSETSATTPPLNLPDLFAVDRMNSLKMNVVQSVTDNFRMSETEFDYESEFTQYSNTFSSAEISDQNEKVLKELGKAKMTKILKTFTTARPPNQCSLQSDHQNIDKSPSIIFNMENSNNASDNKIATRSSAKKYDKNLSFKLDIGNDGRRTRGTSTYSNSKASAARKTPIKRREPSPDLFEEFLNSDEETTNADAIGDSTVNEAANQSKNNEWEKTLLKRLQTALSGVLPPPSKTIIQYSSTELLNMYNENLSKLSEREANELDRCESLLKPTHTVEEAKNIEWNDMKAGIKCHGLLYNRTTDSEDIELLCMKYAERCVGVETSSSFTYTYRPSVNQARMKLLSQSPGTRLSHLVGRKRGLSSVNLMAKQCGSDSSKLGSKQLVIDVQ